MFDGKKIWFINFSGIGNGVMMAPILKCFEECLPQAKYYHTENNFLASDYFIKKSKLNNLIGLSPAGWRRFNNEYWPCILDYVNRNNITSIVNLRNEGPNWDKEYYDFKKYCSKINLKIDFWDLNFKKILSREGNKNITEDIMDIFSSLGVSFKNLDLKWLSDLKLIEGNEIGFCITGSQLNKQWPKDKWAKLGKQIINKSNLKLVLFPGTKEAEAIQAEEMCSVLGNRCSIFKNRNLSSVSKKIGKLKCLISNDTGLLHIAASIGIPIIGIYTNTDPAIWAPYKAADFTAFINDYMYKCPYRKHHCGNCLNYDTCPAIKEFGDNIEPESIFESVEKIMNANIFSYGESSANNTVLEAT